jgi:hypothetical protein
MASSEGIWLLATGSWLLASCQMREASGKKIEPLSAGLTLKQDVLRWRFCAWNQEFRDIYFGCKKS